MSSVPEALAPRSASLGRWPLALLVAVGVLLAMLDTARGMVEIWIRSETFTHAFLVPPIVLWLTWRRRGELARLPARPVPWLLLALAFVALAWLAGDVASVSTLSQFALVAMLVLAVPAVYGWDIARALAFPLGFAFFAVPFGEFAVPQMMDWTADFTVAALRATGIPVFREGLNFVIPSGHWSVVEACSGVRYLIASFMVGTLFAYLTYTSTTKRLLFVAASLVVPIVANWLRAYLIVLVGHLSGNEIAAGADHLVYGWVFFGIVIGAMFFVGMRWADPEPAAADAKASPPTAWHHALPASAWALALAWVAGVWAVQGWARHIHAAPDGAAPTIAIPADATPDELPWPHGFRNPSATASWRHEIDGQPVWVWVGYFRGQNDDRKLVSSVNTWIDGERREWQLTRTGSVAPSGDVPGFRTAGLRQGDVLTSATAARRMTAWRVYWHGQGWTASDVRAKGWQALNTLLGRGDDGAALIVATADDDAADARLQKFARQRLPDIEALLQRARQSP